MAHTKAKGTTKLGRDSQSQRLGVKIYGGSPIKCGQIIIRQRGTVYMPGDGVKRGNDDTLYAVRDGAVKFKKVRYTNFTGNKKKKQIVSVVETADKLKVYPVKSAKGGASEKQFNRVKSEETKQAEQALPEREIIKEIEPPVIPPRKDVRKPKSAIKHTHRK